MGINEGKFGVQEAVCLATISMSTKIFFTSPAFLTNYVGNAGWQMTLISTLTSIIAFSFIYILLKRFPGKDIIQIFDISLGRIIGFIFSFAFAAAFLEAAAMLLREFVDVIKVYVYRETPPDILIWTVVFAAVLSSFLGLETLARISKLTAYIMLVTYFILLLFAIPQYNPTNLFPFFGYGIDKTLIHGIRRSSAYEEVTILAVFAGSLQGTGYIKKAGFISLILSGFILTLGLLSFSMAYPYETTQELIAPIYVLARGIKYGTFFQRLDPIFLFLWIFASHIAISIVFYCAVSCYSKIFRLSDLRPVIGPMAILLYTLAMLPRDFASVIEGNVHNIREYGWAIFYVLPLISLIIAAIRKKKGDTQNA